MTPITDAPGLAPGESSTRAARASNDRLSWIRLGPGRRYFETEDGEPFLIIGQNDALTWPELEGLIGRKDVPGVEAHLAWLADQLRDPRVDATAVALSRTPYVEVEVPSRYRTEGIDRALADLAPLIKKHLAEGRP